MSRRKWGKVPKKYQVQIDRPPKPQSNKYGGKKKKIKK